MVQYIEQTLFLSINRNRPFLPGQLTSSGTWLPVTSGFLSNQDKENMLIIRSPVLGMLQALTDFSFLVTEVLLWLQKHANTSMSSWTCPIISLSGSIELDEPRNFMVISYLAWRAIVYGEDYRVDNKLNLSPLLGWWSNSSMVSSGVGIQLGILNILIACVSFLGRVPHLSVRKKKKNGEGVPSTFHWYKFFSSGVVTHCTVGTGRRKRNQKEFKGVPPDEGKDKKKVGGRLFLGGCPTSGSHRLACVPYSLFNSQT